MKAFRFTLEKVLAFRKRQWEAESALLSNLLEKRRQFEEERRHTEERRDVAEAEFQSAGRLEGSRVAHHAFAAASGERCLRKLDLALRAVDQRVQQQREICLKAKRDFELVDKLREQRWQAWKKETDSALEQESTELHLAQRSRRG